MDLNEKIAARRAELQSKDLKQPDSFEKKIIALGIKDQISSSTKPNQLIEQALVNSAMLRMPTVEKMLFLFGFMFCLLVLFAKNFSIFHFIILIVPICFYFRRRLKKYELEIEKEIENHGEILKSKDGLISSIEFLKDGLSSLIIVFKFVMLLLILLSLALPWKQITLIPSFASASYEPEFWVVIFNLTAVALMLSNMFYKKAEIRVNDAILSCGILLMNITYGFTMNLGAVRSDSTTVVTDPVGGYYLVIMAALSLVGVVYYENKKIQFPSIDIESYVQRFESLKMIQKVAVVLGAFVLAFISFLLLLKVFG
jgi:hypothetical protein